MRYEYAEDMIEDCVTLIDNEDELKTSFDSEIVLYPAEDAMNVIDKLNWYEQYYGLLVKMLKENLEYYGWGEKDFMSVLEDVKANMDE